MDTNTDTNTNTTTINTTPCTEVAACPVVDECVICYEDVCEHDVLEPCRHRMHRQCFLRTTNNLCPVCRQMVKVPKMPKKPVSTIERNLITTIQMVAIIIMLCCFYVTLTIIKNWKFENY